ncbi:MAG: signal peptidase II [Rubricoccaceae bacterium]
MRVLWVTLAILLADQATKVLVRLTMYPGESIPVVGQFFRLTFTENPGMAFGLELGSKLFLTLFSVIATFLIVLYLWHVRRAPFGYRLALACILGGAAGNVIDRVFYGLVWGYGPLFYGNVVDFIHLDVWRGFLPAWVPLVGGSFFALFPIGNIADLAIIAGVVLVLLYQGPFHDQIRAEAVAPDRLQESTAVPAGAAPSVPAPSVPAPSVPAGKLSGNGHATPYPAPGPQPARAPDAAADSRPPLA